jgi:hypothetical protein
VKLTVLRGSAPFLVSRLVTGGRSAFVRVEADGFPTTFGATRTPTGSPNLAQDLQDLQRLLVLGRPTMTELHVDLRAVFQKIRPDFDLASPG